MRKTLVNIISAINRRLTGVFIAGFLLISFGILVLYMPEILVILVSSLFMIAGLSLIILSLEYGRLFGNEEPVTIRINRFFMSNRDRF